MDLRKIYKWILNIFSWARRALLLGLKGLTVAAEGCCPPQEIEKAGRRAKFFLVILISKTVDSAPVLMWWLARGIINHLLGQTS